MSLPAGWTVERTAQLKTLWSEGRSCSEIGRVLKVSRNAVIGKVHRLDLRRPPASPAAYQRKSAKFKAPAKAIPRLITSGNGAIAIDDVGPPAPVLPPIPGSAFKALPGTTPLPFEHRPANGCRWPIDDTDGISRLSCCAPREGEHNYCPTHRALGTSAQKPKTGTDLVRSLRRYA